MGLGLWFIWQIFCWYPACNTIQTLWWQL